MKDDEKFLKKALSKARESAKKGLFPAGAVVVKDGKVISSALSAVFPDYKHSESKAVDQAFEKMGGSLQECTLYCSLEPCLMCMTRAYWAGIRRIVYACRRNAVSQYYYEGLNSARAITNTFNDNVDFSYNQEFEARALEIVKRWERRDR